MWLKALRRRLKLGLARLAPRSLLSRMLLLTLLSVILAQAAYSFLWAAQFRAEEQEGLLSTTRSLALSAAASAKFFKSLPLQYRHIVLDQLRNMGGTRFFVSLNEREIPMRPLPDTDRKRLALAEVEQVLRQTLGRQPVLRVEFVAPQDLRILNGEIPLADLPRSWAHYALTLEPLNPPVLVTQIEIAPNEWLYLAAILPAPYVSLEDDWFPRQHFLFIPLLTAFLLPFIAILVRWQTRPLKRLALAARELPLNEHKPELKERGSAEIVAVTRAFNSMRQRIQRYLNDRERLFSSISHDLKTPITRLRLRVELLEDEVQRAKFEQDLHELELLVKGALQCVKDTDIHENPEPVDVNQLLQHVAEPYLQQPDLVSLEGQAARPYRGKPLALKRCIGNLLDNAIKYGERVTVRVLDRPNALILQFDDQGPGIPDDQLQKIFEPYYRLSKQNEGYGLGLGIARNIAHAHGGELTINNRSQGGLRVTLRLPRYT